MSPPGAMPEIVHGDARNLPLADDTVDLVVTSPPYFGLRSYTDGGRHYEAQIGDEATPDEFVDALLGVTRECVRVLKPAGSLWVNLGDRYSDGSSAPSKSLLGVPWRYALRCIDDLGLVLRAEVVWSKPNGLPESVTDRVRRSHENWFHFTRGSGYFSAVDEIREPYRGQRGSESAPAYGAGRHGTGGSTLHSLTTNALGRLPGSVWEVPSQPLRVPAELGIDHFAAFPMEFPRRLVVGWCPREVCTACGEGRRPVVTKDRRDAGSARNRATRGRVTAVEGQPDGRTGARVATRSRVTDYACACPDASAEARPGVVLDPFGGTGTTALVAAMLGRRGVSVDASWDYCRLAAWRAGDANQRARAAGGRPSARRRRTATPQAALFDVDTPEWSRSV